MAFTAMDVKSLREATGCGMLDCKNALTAADGDMDKAIEILREKGLASAAKKAARVAAEGIVMAYNDKAKKVAAAVEVNSETDFVAKNQGFIDFANACAKAVADCDPADVDALLACKAGDKTLDDMLTDLKLAIRENIKVRRFVRYEGDCETYVHGGGKIGVIVKFDTDCADKEGFSEYGKDVAMQIAAINPPYLCEKCVPAEVLEKEKEIMMVQMQNDPKMANKPEAALAKIIDGKMGKYYKENCLLDQAFVKDDKISIAEYTANTAKDLGGSIKIVDFTRMEKGEGIEKREENFADEIAKLAGGNK